MPNQQSCSHLTQRGRPCRNPAVPGSDPPVCARHRDRPAPQANQPALPIFPAAVAPPQPARPARSTDLADWMAAALKEMGDRYGREL